MTNFRYFLLKDEIEKQIYIYIVLAISTLITVNISYLMVIKDFFCGLVLIYTFVMLCILLENILFLRKWEKNLVV
jgi:hypothetical protein